jgi:hypothetical protein
LRSFQDRPGNFSIAFPQTLQTVTKWPPSQWLSLVSAT